VLVLALESATETAAVAVADEGGPLGSLVVARGRRHTETLASAVEALCRRTGVGLHDLDLLGVGGVLDIYTGLRVGVGTVKALAFALDLPVATATSLEVLAHAVAGSGAAEGTLIVPVVDARRGEVFSARFRARPGPGGPTAATDGAAGAVPEGRWEPEALAADLAGRPEPLVLVGDGALRHAAVFGAVAGATLAGPAYAAPPVTALAELSVARGLAGRVHDAADVMPLYLREADARINWEQRSAPRAPAGGGR